MAKARFDPDIQAIIDHLRTLGSDHNRQGMARFGINIDQAFGISMAVLRPYAKTLGRDQARAEALWSTGFHEARLLAVLTCKPKELSRAVADRWVADFNSWDLCDQACMNVLDRTAYAEDLIAEWTADEREFVRRAGFAIIAATAVHDKNSADDKFLGYLALIEAHASDPRNFVKKAVNWALRQIGKRSLSLQDPALDLSRKLAASDDKTARWIGKDAAKELEKPEIIARLEVRAAKAAEKSRSV